MAYVGITNEVRLSFRALPFAIIHGVAAIEYGYATIGSDAILVKNLYTLRIFLSYDFLLLNSFMIFESDMKTAHMPFVKYYLLKSIFLILSVFYLYSCEEGGKLINDPTTTFETGYY